MSFRKVIFWSHLVAGVGASLVIVLLSVTGVLLTYETQITRWAEGGYDVSAGAAPLPADRLAELALSETGGQASALVFSNDPEAAVLATSGRDGKLFLDPYSGATLGEGSTATGAFFTKVMFLHRWLSLSGPSDTGGAIVGAANLLFGFLLLSGAYLWLPRIWRWGMIKTKILFRRSYPNAKARDFAWHHVFAFWAAIPLFLIILSGVVMSYSWASNLLYAAYGEAAPAARGPGQGGGAGGALAPAGRGNGSGGDAGAGAGLAIAPDGVGLQAVLDTAVAHDPDWNLITLTLPKGGSADQVSVKVDTGTGKQVSRQETLSISQASGEITGVSSSADLSPATQARVWMRFIHTGEVYGQIGQTIAGLATLAALFMAYTGLALAWRRLISPLFRRRQPGTV